MRRRTLVVVSTVVAMLSLLGGAVAAAQDATPAAPAQQPIIPAANQCTVAPRDIAFLERFLGTPAAAAEATPVDPATFQMPEGTEPDRATRQGVLDTIRQAAACLNAGNYLAFLALYSEDFLGRQNLLDPLEEEDLAIFSTTPVPLEGDNRFAILAIVDVRVLPDGRVAALVDIRDGFQVPPVPARILYILVEQEGRWLIDDEVDLGQIDESQVGVPPA
jgi:hypothetical protein